MNDRERRVYEMVLRVLAFLTANAADFTRIPLIGQTATILQAEKETLSELGAEKATKTVDAKDKTIFRGDARDALTDAMEWIARMWRPMAKHHGGAINKFQMNYGSDQLLIDDAGRFINEAAPLEAAFLERGMDPNFIADLTAKRETFVDAVADAEASQGDRIGTNAGFAGPLRRCREAVEDVDPIVKMVYRDNASKLAEWRAASRIERR